MIRLIFLLRLACVALCAALFVPSANAATLNVPAQYTTIQAAVTVANIGDTILVADGTYTSAGNRNIDFGVKDLIIHSVSGNPAQCIIDCQQSGCAFILQNNQTANSNIAGFTIKNGTGFNGNGGGMYISSDNTLSSNNPVINNCVFSSNSVPIRKYPAGNGGGMYGGTATNCIFTGNSAQYGGGIWSGNATNCVFTENTAYTSGGGMWDGNATNCVFNSNSAYSTVSGALGGGMWGGDATNCVFNGNSATVGGGGMYGDAATNCVFTGNSATGTVYGPGKGGGMLIGTATNCVFTGNSAGLGGAVSGITATNCVFTGNSATSGGGGAYNTNLYFCTLTGNSSMGTSGGISLTTNSSATNCIVWGNTAAVSDSNVGGSGPVAYSNVQGGYTGTGNINSNPLFANLSTGNLHLNAGSPCINTATTANAYRSNGTVIPFPTTDLDGGSRIAGNAPDMGAYEYGNVGVLGAIAFFGVAPNAPAQNVTFQFRPVNGGAAINQTYSTTSDGAFYLYGVPDGSYNLWIKSPTYLSALVPVTVAGGVASITATLEPGDANNDNSVDSTDFGVLIGAFNTMASVPGSGYDPTADFNGDGSVDSSDFGLLIGNFNTVGAP